MSKLKMTGAAALLAIAPLLLTSSADARPRGVGGGGMAFQGGGGMAFHGAGGGMAFRGGGATVGGATVGAASVGGVRNPGASFAAVGGPGFAGRGGTAVASPAVHSWNGGWNGGRWGHRHWDGRRWIGPGVGFAAGLATGAALSSPYYGDYGYYYGDGYYADADYGYVGDAYAYDVGPDVTYTSVSGGDSVSYCQRTFRSYDPASGTYLGYDGLRHPCP